jgi:hypothetical protein
LASNNINQPQGIFQWNGLTYVIQQNTGDVYNINGNIPYNRTLAGNVGYIDVRGASQTIDCLGNNLSGSTPYFRYTNRLTLAPPSNRYVQQVTLVSGDKEFKINFGDGTADVVFGPSPATITNETHVYADLSQTYTASTFGFKLNGSFNPNIFGQAEGGLSLYFQNISGILSGDDDPYTFGSFPGIKGIRFDNCTFENLDGVETSPYFSNLQFDGHDNPSLELNTFNLGSKTNLRNLFMINCDMTGFSHDLTSTILDDGVNAFRLLQNTSLVDVNIELPLTINNSFTLGCSTSNCLLQSINTNNGFENLTNLTLINVNRNQLTGWTYNLPSSLITFVASFNARPITFSPNQFGLREFNIDLTSNTLLEEINLQTNRITGITDTIINCISLNDLNLSVNQLTNLPDLPDSITILELEYNNLVDPFISSLPNNLITLLGSNNTSLTDWTIPLTNTSLVTFNFNTCNISGVWDTQFPSTIRTINLSSNQITSMNINLVNGVTTLNISNNSTLTVVTNLSNNNTIKSLDVRDCGFTDWTDLFTTTLPSSLTAFTFNNNSISGSTWPTNAFTNPDIKTVSMVKCGLNTTSVDRIINDIYITTTITSGGSLNLGNSSPTGEPNEPRSDASDTAFDFLNSNGWVVTPP